MGPTEHEEQGGRCFLEAPEQPLDSSASGGAGAAVGISSVDGGGREKDGKEKKTIKKKRLNGKKPSRVAGSCVKS